MCFSLLLSYFPCVILSFNEKPSRNPNTAMTNIFKSSAVRADSPFVMKSFRVQSKKSYLSTGPAETYGDVRAAAAKNGRTDGRTENDDNIARRSRYFFFLFCKCLL